MSPLSPLAHIHGLSGGATGTLRDHFSPTIPMQKHALV
jgi:hypothetical protein